MSEAAGHFEVQIDPETTIGGGIGRFSITKTFHGGLQGTAVGQMLAVRTQTEGSAGYVLIEHLKVTLEGRSGTFMLQHHGIMDRSSPELRVVMIPDSGTQELAGIEGEMSIDAADNHAYVLRYKLPSTF